MESQSFNMQERSAAKDQSLDCLGSTELLPSYLDDSLSSLIGSWPGPQEVGRNVAPVLVNDSGETSSSSSCPNGSPSSTDADFHSNTTNANGSENTHRTLPHKASQAQVESPSHALNHEFRAVTTSPESRQPGREWSDSKGCLLVSPTDGFLNSRGTSNEGTTVWRKVIKGTKRHGKIADEDIQETAAKIRCKYSQVIQQNYTEMYKASGQVKPLLMVEEQDGNDWKYRLSSQRYYWRLSDRYYREASDEAIAKAWSSKPYVRPKPSKPLAQQIADLEEQLRELRLTQPVKDETFDARADVVQELLNLFKPDPIIWKERERNVGGVLKKAFEELLTKKVKQSKRPKKRSRDSTGGSGASDDENAANKKQEGNHPPNQDYHIESPFGDGDGGGAIGGPQARLQAHTTEPDLEIASSSERDGSDSESQTSTENEYGTDENRDKGNGDGSSSALDSSSPSCGTQSDVVRSSIEKLTISDGEDGQEHVEIQKLGTHSTCQPDIERTTKDFARPQPKRLATSEAADPIAASVAVGQDPEASMKLSDVIHGTAFMQCGKEEDGSGNAPHGCIDSQKDATRETGGYPTVESRMKSEEHAPGDLHYSSSAKDAKCIEALETANQHTVPTLQSTTYGSTVVTHSLDASEQLSEFSQMQQQSDPVRYKVACLRSALHVANTADLLYDVAMMARNPANRVMIAEGGGIECILHAMQQNWDIVEIQKNGCWVLLNLAANNSDNQVCIAEAGGHHCILTAMRQHLTEADIQEKGCAALKNLACNGDNQVSVATAGGIECVLNAMRQHTMNVRVQEQGCGALRNLSCQGRNKTKIREAEGIQCILNAMRQHSDNAPVQERGCGAIMSLASNNSDNQNLVAAAGGIPRILIAMRQYPTNAAIQEKGCGALMNLTYNNSSSQDSVAVAGGIQCILDAMKMHSNNASIQEKGCKALCNVAFATNARPTLKANGARQVVRTAKRNFPEDKKVQLASANALKKLPRW